MPIIDSWLGVAIAAFVAFVASSTVFKPDWTKIPTLLAQPAFQSHLFFVLVLSCPPLIKIMGANIIPESPDTVIVFTKACAVFILGISQHLRLPTHPLMPPPGTSLRKHIVSFVPMAFTALATGFFLQGAGLKYGYPPIPGASLFNAFSVVFCILFVYLLFFADLIRKGYSRQWANVALFITLIAIDVQPFHPNPIVTLVSAAAHGAHWVYAVHVAAIAVAVAASRAVEGLKSAPASQLKHR
jgi:hypothetical protein